MESPVELTASLESFVSEQAFGRQLQSRLDEAAVCWRAGAHTAAVMWNVVVAALNDLAAES